MDESWDAVICDLMMPQTPGWELYDQLRLERPELAERMLFMSGGAYTTEGRAFAEAHRERLLPKPFTMAELHQHLARLAPP